MNLEHKKKLKKEPPFVEVDDRFPKLLVSTILLKVKCFSTDDDDDNDFGGGGFDDDVPEDAGRDKFVCLFVNFLNLLCSDDC